MEDQAAFSPDGKLIYFVSTYSGNAEIYRLPFHSDRTLLMKDAEILTHSPAACGRHLDPEPVRQDSASRSRVSTVVAETSF